MSCKWCEDAVCTNVDCDLRGYECTNPDSPVCRCREQELESLNEWAKEIHGNAVTHGWWDEERSFGDIVALCHSELSEALEEYRSGRPMAYVFGGNGEIVTDMAQWGNRKPEGIATEMIDCIIRILDWCGKENIDVDWLLRAKHEYNRTRPYRHGGKAL